MSIFNKPANSITKEDIQELKDNDESESKTLDYKQQVHKSNPGDKNDFLEDICAFANADGGFIVIGIEDKQENGKPTGKPGQILPLAVNADQETLRLDQTILDNTEPKVHTHIQAVEMESGKYVFVVRIPRSPAAPHAVKRESARVFFMRHNGGKHPMDVFELRAAFQRSGAALYQAREFRNMRIPVIWSGQTSVKVIGASTVLHVLPASAFETSALVDLSLLDPREKQNHPLIQLLGFGAPSHPSFNLDGWLCETNTNIRYGAPQSSYVQLFRNGCLEGATGTFVPLAGKHFLGELYEAAVIKILQRFIEALQNMDVVPPLFIGLAINGLEDFHFGYHGGYGGKFETNAFQLPEVVLNSFDDDLGEIMKPAFDVLANAAGFPFSEGYIQDPATGRWRHVQIP